MTGRRYFLPNLINELRACLTFHPSFHLLLHLRILALKTTVKVKAKFPVCFRKYHTMKTHSLFSLLSHHADVLEEWGYRSTHLNLYIR